MRNVMLVVISERSGNLIFIQRTRTKFAQQGLTFGPSEWRITAGNHRS